MICFLFNAFHGSLINTSIKDEYDIILLSKPCINQKFVIINIKLKLFYPPGITIIKAIINHIKLKVSVSIYIMNNNIA